jgi:hypothetical protein
MYIYIYMFKHCFIVLGFKDAHSSNYSIFKMRAAYIKGYYFQNMFLRLGIISDLCIQRNDVYRLLKDIYYMLTYTLFSLLKTPHIVKRALHVQEVHFWHRSTHVVLQWNAVQFEKKCACWREHSFQRDASLLSREPFKVFDHVLTKGFDSTMSIPKSDLQTHWLHMWHVLNKQIKDRIA